MQNARDYYAIPFLGEYRRAVASILQERGVDPSLVGDLLPLYTGQLDQDIALGVLCEPAGPWIFFIEGSRAANRAIQAMNDWRSNWLRHG